MSQRRPSKAQQALEDAALAYHAAWTAHRAIDKAIRAAHGSPHDVYTIAANLEQIAPSARAVTAAILRLQRAARAWGGARSPCPPSKQTV